MSGTNKAAEREATNKLIDELFPDTDDNFEAIDDDLFTETGFIADTTQYVNFQIGNEHYAIDIINILEIVKPSRISSLPSASEHILGLINLRGNIVPVINTHKLFQIPAPDDAENARIILVDMNKSILGLNVDGVSQVIELKKEDIDPPMVTLEVERTEFILGEANIDGQLVAVLDIGKLVDSQIFIKS
jgi:purine-binding chemotaxis protein CheW